MYQSNDTMREVAIRQHKSTMFKFKHGIVMKCWDSIRGCNPVEYHG